MRFPHPVVSFALFGVALGFIAPSEERVCEHDPPPHGNIKWGYKGCDPAGVPYMIEYYDCASTTVKYDENGDIDASECGNSDYSADYSGCVPGGWGEHDDAKATVPRCECNDNGCLHVSDHFSEECPEQAANTAFCSSCSACVVGGVCYTEDPGTGDQADEARCEANSGTWCGDSSSKTLEEFPPESYLGTTEESSYPYVGVWTSTDPAEPCAYDFSPTDYSAICLDGPYQGNELVTLNPHEDGYPEHHTCDQLVGYYVAGGLELQSRCSQEEYVEESDGSSSKTTFAQATNYVAALGCCGETCKADNPLDVWYSPQNPVPTQCYCAQ